jgi:hypothetical protein
VTREHVFRGAWRDKLDLLPSGVREFTQVQNGRLTTRDDGRAMDLKVRRVCRACNNGWMNALDSEVEPWLLNPDALVPSRDVTAFRRWAIKLALLRTMVDNPYVAPRSDFKALYDGHDIPDWHIFIARTVFPEHRHVFACPPSPLNDDRSMMSGLFGASWSLGTALVTTLRVVNMEPEKHWIRAFRDFIHMEGDHFAEVEPGAGVIPSLALKPRLPNLEIIRYFWFFTDHPASPVADAIARLGRVAKSRNLEAGFDEHGQPLPVIGPAAPE